MVSRCCRRSFPIRGRARTSGVLPALWFRAGFDAEIDEDEPDPQKLVDLVLAAESCRGCKCANVGAVRITLEGGTVVGVGLLPSHDEQYFKLRFYIDNRFLGAYRVDRTALGRVFESLGVPLDDYPFFE